MLKPTLWHPNLTETGNHHCLCMVTVCVFFFLTDATLVLLTYIQELQVSPVTLLWGEMFGSICPQWFCNLRVLSGEKGRWWFTQVEQDGLAEVLEVGGINSGNYSCGCPLPYQCVYTREIFPSFPEVCVCVRSTWLGWGHPCPHSGSMVSGWVLILINTCGWSAESRNKRGKKKKKIGKLDMSLCMYVR